jgi:hypothetical protein
VACLPVWIDFASEDPKVVRLYSYDKKNFGRKTFFVVLSPIVLVSVFLNIIEDAYIDLCQFDFSDDAYMACF